MSQNSQENTYGRFSFSKNLLSEHLQLYEKQDPRTGVSCEYGNSFFYNISGDCVWQLYIDLDQWSKILQIPIEKTYYKLWYFSNSVLVELDGSTDKVNHNCRLPLQKLITSENGLFENVVFDFMSCSWEIQFLVFWNHSINIESCDFIMTIIKWGRAHFLIVWLWNLSN